MSFRIIMTPRGTLGLNLPLQRFVYNKEFRLSNMSERHRGRSLQYEKNPILMQSPVLTGSGDFIPNLQALVIQGFEIHGQSIDFFQVFQTAMGLFQFLLGFQYESFILPQ